jgi:hypothetical protein
MTAASGNRKFSHTEVIQMPPRKIAPSRDTAGASEEIAEPSAKRSTRSPSATSGLPMPEPSSDLSNLRTEYSELSRYYTGVVKYRFTLLGFLIVAQGIILSSKHPHMIFLFALIVTLAFWIIDRKTRATLRMLENRARNIEERWGNNGRESMFFHVLFHGDNEQLGHSVGIDMIIGTLLAADLWMLL